MTDRNLQTGQLVDQVVQMKRMLGQYVRIVEISLTLNSTLDPQQLLGSIIETGTEVLECEAVSVLLYDEKLGELRFAASTDANPEELAKIPVPLESSIAGAIFMNDAVQIMNNLAENPQHFQGVADKTQFVTRNLVGVPMKIGDKIIGVLEGVNKISEDFDQNDADLLMVIASQAAVAINNSNLMQNLQNAYDEVSALDRKKSDFIAIASHELKIPLNTILGYAEFLREDSEGVLADYAEKLLKAAFQLRTLINDMTNIDLLEEGKQEIEISTRPIQRIVADAYKEIKDSADQKQQKLTITLPKDPINIEADPGKLGQVFHNLLSNAVRFTPEHGKIHIQVDPHPRGVLITIRDNGIGIPPKEIESIFDEFYQVEDHHTRVYGGMGLGLAIARGIVQAHNGTIWAESEGEGKGASFFVLLPASKE